MVTLTGDSGDNTLIALSNTPHTILGLAGNDLLIGGTSNDYLDGGPGRDSLVGGLGDDVIVWEGWASGQPDPLDAYDGGEGFDRLIVLPATPEGGLRSLDLSDHGFERAEIRSDQSTDYYVDGWLLYAQNIYDAGRLAETYVFDYASANPWSFYRQSFGADSSLQWQATYYDDLSSAVQVFDAAGAADWRFYTDFYDAMGRLVARQTVQDSGAYQSTYFDLGAEAWSHYTDFHSAAGDLLARQALFDDGALQNTYFDALNQNSWREYTDYFDADGVFIGRAGVNDDGSLF
jgi:Ca2+-binding RTX toxin-like protein